jgi:general secretion pathway protein N
MRIADAGTRTWLLAVFAAWALCVWLLALFGMGGGIQRLEEDDSLLRPLPATFQPGPERLGPLPQYAEAGRRPMFTENRRPQPYLIDPMAEEQGGRDFDFVLTSVLRTPTLEMAILQPAGGGRSVGVKVGESPEGVAGWTLASVASRSAVFNGPEGERTLQLRQFDGIGGEAPTEMGMAAMPADQPASAVAGPPMDDDGMPVAEPRATVAQGADDQARTGAGDPAAGQDGDAAAVRTSQEQVEAIRKRIEERRARLRQQGRQDQQGNRTP